MISNLSLAFLNVLVLGVSITILVRDQQSTLPTTSSSIETGRELSVDEPHRRNLLQEEYDFFVGPWYDCYHTTLQSFEGEVSDKVTVDVGECNGDNLGNITTIREKTSVLSFDIYRLNRCSFHGLGEQGRPPCPHDSLPGQPPAVGTGSILVKYSFKGVGSLAGNGKSVDFYADQLYTRKPDGEWKSDFEMSKLENVDSLKCQKQGIGMVCDWYLNEYRTAAVDQLAGCQLNGECKPGLGRTKCANAGGEWTEACPRTKYVAGGFSYESMSSFYLVKNMTECPAEYCATEEDSASNR